MKWLVGIGALLAGISVFYYLVIYLPSNHEQELKTADYQLKQRQDCLAKAESDYSYNWNKNCATQGLQDNCSLPSNWAKTVEDYRTSEKNDCFKLYPVN
jgi:hypothetical protein